MRLLPCLLLLGLVQGGQRKKNRPHRSISVQKRELTEHPASSCSDGGHQAKNLLQGPLVIEVTCNHDAPSNNVGPKAYNTLHDNLMIQLEGFAKLLSDYETELPELPTPLRAIGKRTLEGVGESTNLARESLVDESKVLSLYEECLMQVARMTLRLKAGEVDESIDLFWAFFLAVTSRLVRIADYCQLASLEMGSLRDNIREMYPQFLALASRDEELPFLHQIEQFLHVLEAPPKTPTARRLTYTELQFLIFDNFSNISTSIAIFMSQCRENKIKDLPFEEMFLEPYLRMERLLLSYTYMRLFNQLGNMDGRAEESFDCMFIARYFDESVLSPLARSLLHRRRSNLQIIKARFEKFHARYLSILNIMGSLFDANVPLLIAEAADILEPYAQGILNRAKERLAEYYDLLLIVSPDILDMHDVDSLRCAENFETVKVVLAASSTLGSCSAQLREDYELLVNEGLRDLAARALEEGKDKLRAVLIHLHSILGRLREGVQGDKALLKIAEYYEKTLRELREAVRTMHMARLASEPAAPGEAAEGDAPTAAVGDHCKEPWAQLEDVMHVDNTSLTGSHIRNIKQRLLFLAGREWLSDYVQRGSEQVAQDSWENWLYELDDATERRTSERLAVENAMRALAELQKVETWTARLELAQSALIPAINTIRNSKQSVRILTKVGKIAQELQLRVDQVRDEFEEGIVMPLVHLKEQVMATSRAIEAASVPDEAAQDVVYYILWILLELVQQKAAVYTRVLTLMTSPRAKQ